jgi:hypothetical protein
VSPAPGGVVLGDELYFHHGEHGPLCGRVAALGEHGVQIEHELAGDARYFPVPWEKIHGHKARKKRRFLLVDRGEDGAIAEDEDGRRVFIRGEIPEDETDGEPGEPLAKALAPELLETTEPLLSPRDLAAIDAALMAAGFEPSLDYIRATYGDHWSRQAPPSVPVYDDALLRTLLKEAVAGSASASEMATQKQGRAAS